ncbi:unnamed protein product, partial [Ectocarpus sp. 12 AP-2014]
GADSCDLYAFKSAAHRREDADRAALERSKALGALQAVRRKLRSRLSEERWHWSRRRGRSGEERQTCSKADTYAAAKEQAAKKRR